MITIYRNARRIIKNVPDFCGLSSDEKPMDAKNGSTFLEIDTGNTFKFDEEGKNWYEQPQGGGGSGGTTDYTQLENKPSINGITLEGNQTTEELDIIPVVDLGKLSGEPPFEISLNQEQIQTMQKDSCIVSIIEGDSILYFNKVGISEGVILFTSLVNGNILTLMVDTIELKGLLNSYNAMQIPSPTGPDDAGKVPVVNPEGTGWLLESGGLIPQRSWRQIADLDFAQLREQGVGSFSDDTIKNATKVLVDCQTIINADSATDSGLWIMFNDKSAPLANVWFPTYHNGTSGARYQKTLVEFDGGFVFAIRGGNSVGQNNNTPSSAQVTYGTMLPFDGFVQKISLSWGLGDSTFTDILSGKLIIYVYEEEN